MNMKSINPDTCCSSCKRYGTTPEKFPIWCSDNDCKCHQPTMNQIPNIERTHDTEVEEIVEEIFESGKWYGEDIGYAKDEVQYERRREAIDKGKARIHHQLQKARHDWLREEIVKLKGMIHEINTEDEYAKYDGQNKAIQTIIDRYQAEVDQDKALQDKK